jgi:hypothetical protein
MSTQKPPKKKIRTIPAKAPKASKAKMATLADLHSLPPGHYQSEIVSVDVEDGGTKVVTRIRPIGSTMVLTHISEVEQFRGLDRKVFTTKVREILQEAPSELLPMLMGSSPDFKQGLVLGWLLGKGLDARDFRSRDEWEAVVDALATPSGDGWGAIFD